jgi:hypothetical protein
MHSRTSLFSEAQVSIYKNKVIQYEQTGLIESLGWASTSVQTGLIESLGWVSASVSQLIFWAF